MSEEEVMAEEPVDMERDGASKKLREYRVQRMALMRVLAGQKEVHPRLIGLISGGIERDGDELENPLDYSGRIFGA